MANTNYYFMVLDIETSTEKKYDEKLGKEMPVKTWLSYGICQLYNIKGCKIRNLRFRKWKELTNFFYSISEALKNKKIVCYVHNLSYEFDFLIKNVARPKKFLCNSSHSVISAELEGLRIIFKCTYQLSKMSLRKIGELYQLPKLESEYRTIYPNEKVTEEEWIYCERDCEVMIPYILDELSHYGLLWKIPLTSTGKVRVELKELLNSGEKGDWDLMPPENCYEALNKTFRGAITMSNPRFTGVKINTTVKSFDEKSKYPGVMLCNEFPHSIVKLESFNNETYKNYKFWIGKIRINDLISKYDWGYLSSHTSTYVEWYDADIFNGKIINCHCVELYICNVDLDIINMVYNYDSIEFLEFYACPTYGRLPNQFIELIKIFAEPKSRIGKELKKIEEEYGENSREFYEKYREYMESKSKLNGIYGMMVQKLVPTEYYIDEQFMWREKDLSYKCIPDKHLGRNFLHGIFITAYSRYDLVRNIIHNCPYNFVYCDTDSIKYIDIGKPFEDLNDEIPEYLQQFSYLKGFNRFEEEEPYTEFITYGAKKYAYIRHGMFGFTVAGLPKSTTIKSFDDFQLGTTYQNCKLAKRYIYQSYYTDVDFFSNRELDSGDLEEESFGGGGIALFETDYKLNMTKEDMYYITVHKKIWQKRNIQQNIMI